MAGAGNYVILRKTGGVGREAVLQLYPALMQLAVAGLRCHSPISNLALTGFMAVARFGGCLLIIASLTPAPGIVVARMQHSQILWAAVLEALLFDEAMSGRAVVAVVIIVIAGVVIVTRRDRVI